MCECTGGALAFRGRTTVGTEIQKKEVAHELKPAMHGHPTCDTAHTHSIIRSDATGCCTKKGAVGCSPTNADP